MRTWDSEFRLRGKLRDTVGLVRWLRQYARTTRPQSRRSRQERTAALDLARISRLDIRFPVSPTMYETVGVNT